MYGRCELGVGSSGLDVTDNAALVRTLGTAGLNLKDPNAVRSLGRQLLLLAEKMNVASLEEAPPATSNKEKKRTNKNKANGKARSTVLAPQRETLEDCKIRHSQLLSKVFEQADPIFKKMRQKILNLSLECTLPKDKKKRAAKGEEEVEAVNNPGSDGLGGKAGKSRYIVLVGEVDNLYKTGKSRRGGRNNNNQASQQQKTVTVDLHGCTQVEALAKLGEGLPWNRVIHL